MYIPFSPLPADACRALWSETKRGSRSSFKPPNFQKLLSIILHLCCSDTSKPHSSCSKKSPVNTTCLPICLTNSADLKRVVSALCHLQIDRSLLSLLPSSVATETLFSPALCCTNASISASLQGWTKVALRSSVPPHIQEKNGNNWFCQFDDRTRLTGITTYIYYSTHDRLFTCLIALPYVALMQIKTKWTLKVAAQNTKITMWTQERALITVHITSYHSIVVHPTPASHIIKQSWITCQYVLYTLYI